ncbi:hypothetical protein TcasGA2_TC000958 [Tribolium castaneum]|uniref:Uncharacterized protein n=1 Tax=Tribolium castaneum TaxID=7070 RepID=D6W996_TRICA|nr:hypothetical protein TcasGA2_TC000958 [Tribolium castaneum]
MLFITSGPGFTEGYVFDLNEVLQPQQIADTLSQTNDTDRQHVADFRVYKQMRSNTATYWHQSVFQRKFESHRDSTELVLEKLSIGNIFGIVDSIKCQTVAMGWFKLLRIIAARNRILIEGLAKCSCSATSKLIIRTISRSRPKLCN